MANNNKWLSRHWPATLCASAVLWFAGSSLAAETDQLDTLPLDELTALTDAYSLVKDSFVDEVSDREMLQGAIKGMLRSIDPHSTYLTPEEFASLQQSTAGQYDGLGLNIRTDDAGLRIVSVVDKSPASLAGIIAGDRILTVDGQQVEDTGNDRALELLDGELGESVQLSLKRKGLDTPIDLELVREQISVSTVSHLWMDDQIAYIKIEEFQRNTQQDLINALNKFKQNASSKGTSQKGVILDLRNNPGGLLNSGVRVADVFLNNGLVVYTKGRSEGSKSSYSAAPGDYSQNLPLVVLINGGSASASEIVAGALQDRDRATIVGSRSYGKGSVQSIFPLPDKSAVKLTTALYYTPSGRSIQGAGIDPDITIRQTGAPLRLLPEPTLESRDSEQGSIASIYRERIEADSQLTRAIAIIEADLKR